MLRNLAYCGIGILITLADRRRPVSRKRRRFDDQVVLITGSSRGLGLALAEEFAHRGAKIVLTARDAERLSRAQKRLLDSGAVKNEKDILLVPADLRRREEGERVIRKATDRFGRVDVLINNAGIITVAPAENQRVEDFQEAMAVNFFATVYCTWAVLPQMLARQSGAIVNITSIGGKVAVPHLLPYTASKFAAVGFSEGLHAELRPKGVRVTTVVPGLMRTGSHRQARFAGDASAEYRWFSLGASLPGVSIAASRAARQIADATASGTAEVTITPQAYLASRLGNLAPIMRQLVLCAVNRFLPKPQQERGENYAGNQVRDRELTTLTGFGSYAARRYNQSGAA